MGKAAEEKWWWGARCYICQINSSCLKLNVSRKQPERGLMGHMINFLKGWIWIIVCGLSAPHLGVLVWLHHRPPKVGSVSAYRKQAKTGIYEVKSIGVFCMSHLLCIHTWWRWQGGIGFRSASSPVQKVAWSQAGHIPCGLFMSVFSVPLLYLLWSHMLHVCLQILLCNCLSLNISGLQLLI